MLLDSSGCYAFVFFCGEGSDNSAPSWILVGGSRFTRSKTMIEVAGSYLNVSDEPVGAQGPCSESMQREGAGDRLKSILESLRDFPWNCVCEKKERSRGE